MRGGRGVTVALVRRSASRREACCERTASLWRAHSACSARARSREHVSKPKKSLTGLTAASTRNSAGSDSGTVARSGATGSAGLLSEKRIFVSMSPRASLSLSIPAQASSFAAPSFIALRTLFSAVSILALLHSVNSAKSAASYPFFGLPSSLKRWTGGSLCFFADAAALPA